MKDLKYLLQHPLDTYESKRIHAAAQKLMTDFEISGVFSEVLMDKVFSSLWNAIYSIEKNDKEEAANRLKQITSILETYNIFSDRFKANCKCEIDLIIRIINE